MAMINTTPTAPFGAETVYRVVTLVDRMIAHIRGWFIAQDTAEGLRKLTDRELHDLGLDRAQIDEVADAMARRVA